MPYEPRRFQSAVPYYERYRLAYPERLIARVVALAGLKPGDAVLDLGCGPGLAGGAVRAGGHGGDGRRSRAGHAGGGAKRRRERRA